MAKVWRGWELDERLVVAPRRVWLKPSEARIMLALMEAKGEYRLPDDLMNYTGQPTLTTMRSKIATLRDAIGKKAIFMSRDYGYRLLPADDRHGTTADPIDVLIQSLTDALEAARRVKRTTEIDKENA